MQDLISFVQSHGKKQREDLAGEVLALLLREEPGQNLLREILGIIDVDNSAIEVLTRNVVDGCVPDIRLIRNVRAVAVIELKFWATLTDHQLSGKYFNVAPVVIFIVPERRKPSIELQLAKEAANQSVRIISWTEFLGDLERLIVVDSSRDVQLLYGALKHLKEFCKVETEIFDPFTPEQLGKPDHNQIARHLVWLTKAAIASATHAGVIQEAGRIGAGYDDFFFYGQSIILSGFKVWFGFWPLAWLKSPALGPLWVQFHGTGATTLIQAKTFSDGVHLDGLAFPLLRPSTEGVATQEDEVLAVTAALRALGERLLSIRSNTPQDQVVM